MVLTVGFWGTFLSQEGEKNEIGPNSGLSICILFMLFSFKALTGSNLVSCNMDFALANDLLYCAALFCQWEPSTSFETVSFYVWSVFSGMDVQSVDLNVNESSSFGSRPVIGIFCPSAVFFVPLDVFLDVSLWTTFSKRYMGKSWQWQNTKTCFCKPLKNKKKSSSPQLRLIRSVAVAMVIRFSL